VRLSNICLEAICENLIVDWVRHINRVLILKKFGIPPPSPSQQPQSSYRVRRHNRITNSLWWFVLKRIIHHCCLTHRRVWTVLTLQCQSLCLVHRRTSEPPCQHVWHIVCTLVSGLHRCRRSCTSSNSVSVRADHTAEVMMMMVINMKRMMSDERDHMWQFDGVFVMYHVTHTIRFVACGSLGRQQYSWEGREPRCICSRARP